MSYMSNKSSLSASLFVRFPHRQHHRGQTPSRDSSPTAAGGESRRSLLCSGGAGTGCARFCGPGKCGGQVQGGAAAGQGSGLRRAGAGGRCVVGLAAGRCRGRGGPQAAPAQPGPAGFARRNRPPDGLTCGPLQTCPLQKIPRPQSGDFATYFGIIPRRELLPQRAPPRGPHPPAAP